MQVGMLKAPHGAGKASQKPVSNAPVPTARSVRADAARRSLSRSKSSRPTPLQLEPAIQLPPVTSSPEQSSSQQPPLVASATQVETSTTTSTSTSSNTSSGDNMSTAKITAAAQKINAARELARRLSQEKQAEAEGGDAMRTAEEASAAAAAQMGKADAIARAMRRTESTRDQLQRLRAENEALRELLMELAADKNQARAKMNQITESSSSLRPGSPTPSTRSISPSALSSGSVDIPEVAAPAAPEALNGSGNGVAAASTVVAPPPVSPPEPKVSAPEPIPDIAAVPEPSTHIPTPTPTHVPTEAVAAPPAVVVPEVQVEVQTPAPVSDNVVRAPRGILQTRPPRAPGVAERIRITTQNLQAMAIAAAQTQAVFFTVPAMPVPVDGPVRVFYNRAKGPLPPASRVVLKLGLNKWDIVQDIAMSQATELPQTIETQWYEATLDIPPETFKVDFVLFDQISNQYDNNKARDYSLALWNAPTEQQLMDLRLQEYRRFETQRLAYLEYENSLLWKAVQEAAEQAAAQARVDFRKRRAAQLRDDARTLVEQRRKVELAGLPVQDAQPGVFSWTVKPTAGGKAFIAYNKGSGPLANSNNVRVHVGYDGWYNSFKKVYDLNTMSTDDINKNNLATFSSSHNQQQWWGTWVDIPESGMVLDFVFSDNNNVMWDNNGFRDYHTRINGALTSDDMTKILYQEVMKEKEAQDQIAEERVARQAMSSMASRGEVLRRRRAVLNNFLYTVPYTPTAGQTVEIYYNPDNSPLRGRPNIYMKVGYNRWSLQAGGQGGRVTQIIKMEPTLSGGIGFYTANVQLPKEAWGLDLAFVDTPTVSPRLVQEALASGFVDNNNGLDYHLPVRTLEDGDKVIGAVSLPVKQPLRIIHVAVEMAPIAKVGGMGDVVTALGRAVQQEGHQVEVILPKYDCINYKQVEDLRQDASFHWTGVHVKVWKGRVEGLNTIFLEPDNGHFWRGCIYGRNDDHIRFGFHCGAALAYLQNYNIRPNILHCHDWQSAPIAWGLRGSARAVFTIHNLSYGADLIGRAMASCEVATTVSPTYAQEIAGNGAVAPHLDKLYGILNGIDTEVWDPADDEHIPVPYGPDSAKDGKAAARAELRNRMGLSHIDVPIVACVTRLVAQKGIHLIKHAAWRTLERGGQFVLLGSAPDPRVQAEFNALRDQLKAEYHDRAALEFKYNEPLSHLIYAGADLFLVPSIFEPCGLTQMIAMRYGAVPVVRKTGGLADTVFDVDHDEDRAVAAGMVTNGYSFESTDNAGLDYALNRAMAMWYNDKAGWEALVQRVMDQDWSWFKPALDYLDLYYKALRS